MVSGGWVQDPLEVFDSSEQHLPWYGQPFRRRSALVPKKPTQWEVYRPIKGSPGPFIGVVEAPDETSALKAAIEEFGIVNPDQQKRLFVRRVPSDDD